MKRCSSATEGTDTRTLGKPKSSQTMLRNGQHGSGIKAVLKRSSDWKKSNPVDEENHLREVGEHCAGEVQQVYMFGTPDKYAERNIESVVWYICQLEGSEQVNVQCFLSRRRVRHPGYDTDPCYGGKANATRQWDKSITDATDSSVQC